MTEGRALPVPTPETQHFWEGARSGKLVLQRCCKCKQAYFPPRPFCPHCSSKEIETFDATGRASLYSYIISHRPGQGLVPPYAIAVVELEEGPRMMSNIIGVPQTPEALRLDMPLKVVFEKLSEDISLPLFQPAEVEV